MAKVLHDDLDRGAATRIWRGVAARRIQRRRLRERRDLALAFAAGIAAAVVFLLAPGLATTPRATTAREAPEAPLALRASIDWPEMAEPRGEARTLDFADGSHIALGADGALALLENTGRSVVLLLKNGKAQFDIVPGGPRRWSIEAGFATVEVVGTRFAVTRSREHVTVEVEHGNVLVRGEHVADRVKRLGAGERLVIERESSPLPVAPPAPTAPARASTSASNAPPPAALVQRPTAPAWHQLAEEGAYAEAYRNLGADGIAVRSKTADLEQLLALADVARLSGHPRDAVAPLRRVMADHADDPRAAMAAFMLGRLHLDALEDPSGAMGDFRQAIALKVPAALREDAHLRLIEAAARAGDLRAARNALETYRQLFPDSSRRSVAERWGRAP
jgi:transmembrane sensor